MFTRLHHCIGICAGVTSLIFLYFLFIHPFQANEPYAESKPTQEDRSPCPMPPGQYLVRSDCPFASALIDGECRVVCPVPQIPERKNGMPEVIVKSYI